MPKVWSQMRRTNTKRSPVLEMPRTVGAAEKGKGRGRAENGARRAPPGPAAQDASQAPAVVTPSKSLLRAPRARALELILETAIRDHEGFRTGALGLPRFGKTYHLEDLIRLAIALGIIDRAFIHDVKKAVVQYEGAVASGSQEWAENIDQYTTDQVVVFHASYPAPRPTVQEVCSVAREVASEGESVLVVVDELYKATTGGRAWLKGPDDEPALIAEFLREGSSQRISTAWTTQIPQSLPTEALVLTETCALFHLEGLAATYVTDSYRLDAEAALQLESLVRGEFLLFNANRKWDRTIYGPG